MTLHDAKKSLYHELKQKHPIVVGVTIHENGEIVVFLSRKRKKVISDIPPVYHGHKVAYRIVGPLVLLEP